jgi:predicted N-acetyltransferase YhbS
MPRVEDFAMTTIRYERPSDAAAREALLDAAFGAARFAKASERLREASAPAAGLAFVASDRGRLVGTLRLWPIWAGEDRPALLLGPLAVAADRRDAGIGGRLMRRAIEAARAQGHDAVLLVGDAPYYGRFGFSAAKTGDLRMPGPYEPERLLALELAAGALDGARGLIARAPELAPNAGPSMPRQARRGAASFDLSYAA